MASLYHHSSFPLSPPHQLTAPEPPRAPSSSHHGSALPRPGASPSFACHCKAPPRDHDAELLRALQSNGNGTLHGEPVPLQVLDSRSDGPGGNGRGKRPRICARDCAKRIMELPVEERVKVLDLLQRDDAAITVSDYNDILFALARAGDHASAVALFRAMPVAPDAHSFATAVQCLCRQGAPDEAKLGLDEMVARGFRPSVATFSAVVGCLCKRGRVTKAMEVFDAMRALGCEPTIRTYNSLVGGLCYVGRLEEALDLLNKLKDTPKTPDIYTFTIVLDGFCKVGRAEEATAIFHDATGMGLSPTIFTYNALLNGHCKEGNPLRAFALLMEMCGDEGGCPPDRISFGIVLTALLRAGETAAAWQTYKRMERAGFEADGRALDTLARGLCRRCATDVSALGDAREVFAKLVASGHEPVSYTYCLMAQALARGGEVDAAVALLEEMVRRGYALRKRAYTDVVRALCDRGRARDALRVLVLVMIVRDFVPGRNAFDALLGELGRQGRWTDAMAVYAAAVKRGVVVSWKHLSREEEPVRLGVPQ
ncbi:protein Rf1, mitochondrial-like [Panicum miliaceum]|uniref:Protein Rf1, mitochondrial-like n=1 Tax=Panicum miliaceum TaxID=4540 RepID=A0A3L6TR97_PANMI|nr:protein Rf1, mitochondrial-like [Panicum miliaceum]